VDRICPAASVVINRDIDMKARSIRELITEETFIVNGIWMFLLIVRRVGKYSFCSERQILQQLVTCNEHRRQLTWLSFRYRTILEFVRKD